MFYNLLFGKEGKHLSKIDEDVAKELADFRDYTVLYNKKVKLLKKVVDKANNYYLNKTKPLNSILLKKNHERKGIQESFWPMALLQEIFKKKL